MKIEILRTGIKQDEELIKSIQSGSHPYYNTIDKRAAIRINDIEAAERRIASNKIKLVYELNLMVSDLLEEIENLTT
tara:strand:- start:1059 stop:1289 length:231 start_codon:yes stop_codon:yes gene_type:complete